MVRTPSYTVRNMVHYVILEWYISFVPSEDIDFNYNGF